MPHYTLLSWGLGVFFLVVIAALFSKRVQEFLVVLFSRYPISVFFVPLALSGLYNLYTTSIEVSNPVQEARMIVYFLLPTTLVYGAECWFEGTRKAACCHMAAIAFIWLGLDLRWVVKRWRDDVSDYPFTSLAASVLGIILWRCFAQLEGMNIQYRPTESVRLIPYLARNISVVCGVFTILACVLIPYGLSITFLHKPEFVAEASGNAEIAAGVLSRLLAWRTLLGFMGYAVGVALPEELLFRSIIQNALAQALQRFVDGARTDYAKVGRTGLIRRVNLAIASSVMPTVITSFLFGLGHLNNGAKGRHPALWNWKYMNMAMLAGIGYGVVFNQTQSLIFPMALHALVNVIWGTIFR